MSASNFDTRVHSVDPSFNKFDIPVKMGLIIGLVMVFMDTVNFKFVLPANFMIFSVMFIVMFFVSFGLYVFTGFRQRKAMGGYINIKEAFQAIFVTLLISVVISTIWGLVYAKWVDPTVSMRVKEETLDFMARMKAPKDKIDESAAQIDKQLKDGMKFGKILLGLAQKLVLYSIFGMLCALIVKKDRPVQLS